MSISEDLKGSVAQIFRDAWHERKGQKVPEHTDVGLWNEAVALDATVLYADLVESTALVDGYLPLFAAEIYKTYLHCASQIIKNEGGVITSYDGDRVMAVFIGDYKNTSAARCALMINYAVSKIINPALKAQYPLEIYQVRHAIGIDRSQLLAARTGVRGDNDLVWVGRSANYAAKLCSLRLGYPINITKDVYDKLQNPSKFGSDGSTNMWTQQVWKEKNIYVYCSSWTWEP